MTRAAVACFFATIALSIVLTQAEKPFVCYWESWSRYRAAPYTGNVDDIPVHLCTHLIYAFAGLDENTWKVKSLEPYWDFDLRGFRQLVALKTKNPKLKVSFAIGGWNEGATKYSDLVSDRSRIDIFVQSIAEWINFYGFDGVDLDWEYPADAARGGRSQDKDNLIVLLRALREALSDKIVTIATCMPASKIAAGYDVPKIVQYVDFIHVMTYDLRGGWDPVIGNHVSLYPSSNDKGPYAQLTVAQGMQNWVEAGAPKSKLILGLAFYGRSFTLRDSGNTKQGAPASGNGLAGPVSQQEGNLFYFEICKKLGEGWIRQFDNETKSPFAYSGNQWVGYDDVDGISNKLDYVTKQNFAGVMIWAIGLDDASNSCGQGNYPLANAAFKSLRKGDDEENEIDLDLSTPSKTPAPEEQTTESSGKEPEPLPTTETPRKPEPSEEVTKKPKPSTTKKPKPSTTKKPSTDLNVDCSSGLALLPHPKMCSKFIQCVSRKPVEKTCPEGLLFDNATSVCNWPADVDPKLPEGCPDGNP